MKQIFLKAVRKDGSSVWAPPGLGVVYEIGKRYTFPKYLPAHVMPVPDTGLSSCAFASRREAGTSSRVVICYGEMEERTVPFVGIDEFNAHCVEVQRSTEYASHDFEVIGEMFVPSSWCPFFGEEPRRCDGVSAEVLEAIHSRGKLFMEVDEAARPK